MLFEEVGVREPHFQILPAGEQIPYSHAPSEWLKNCGSDGPNLEELEHHDTDFRRRYAAILLKERGL